MDEFGRFIVFVLIIHGILTIVSCCQASTRYLCNLVKLDDIFEDIERAIDSPPEISFHIQCWHMEERVEYRTDDEGNETRHVHMEKVVTHTADKDFKIKKWYDESPPAKTLHFLSVLLLSRLKTEKFIEYSSKARKRVEKKEKKFIRKNDDDDEFDY